MRKELDWMRRQPKARGTKAKYREDAFYVLKDKAQQQVKDDRVQLEMQTARQGKQVLELSHLFHAYDDLKILDDFSYTFKRGDRIGVIGKNGVGKTTFLEILTQSMPPKQGEVNLGKTTKMGYYSQEEFPFDPQQRVIDTVKEVAEVITMSDNRQITASQLLNLFLFPPEAQYGVVGKLSGGERRRLQLLRVLITNPNFLILDEPTNDLDLQTLNVLEDFLTGFPGCLLVVSHDRYFMDKLVDHSFIFEGNGKVRDFPGNYTDYRNMREEEEEKEVIAKKLAPEPTVKKSQPEEKTKLSFKEKREYEQLTEEIDSLEVEKKSLIENMNHGEMDHEALTNAGARIGEIDDLLEKKTDRWLYLSEFVS